MASSTCLYGTSAETMTWKSSRSLVAAARARNASSTNGWTTVGVAAVVRADALAHEVRVRDEARHPADVVTSHRRSRARERPARSSALRPAREVVVEAVPDVAHRRVAVAEVRLAARVDAFRDGVAGQMTRSNPREIPLPHRARKERQERAVVARRACASGCSDEVWIVRDSIACETLPGKWNSVKSSASGTRSRIASSTCSPPRMPVSQSWMTATRLPRHSSSCFGSGVDASG